MLCYAAIARLRDKASSTLSARRHFAYSITSRFRQHLRYRWQFLPVAVPARRAHAIASRQRRLPVKKEVIVYDARPGVATGRDSGASRLILLSMALLRLSTALLSSSFDSSLALTHAAGAYAR